MSEEDILKIIVVPDREPSPYSMKLLAYFSSSSNKPIPLNAKMYQFRISVRDSLNFFLRRSTTSKESEETDKIWDNFRDWINVYSRLMQAFCSYEVGTKNNELLNATATPLYLPAPVVPKPAKHDAITSDTSTITIKASNYVMELTSGQTSDSKEKEAMVIEDQPDGLHAILEKQQEENRQINRHLDKQDETITAQGVALKQMSELLREFIPKFEKNDSYTLVLCIRT